ncbi:hypothetical protein GCM10010406_54690 [Streptomyces thermolineatus]|uniref:Uncharacterized protein n=1 Tax=Streptomyces thermolineatus TaxID=44033 RepID=A0ABP6AA19_9ACTN
MLSPRFPRAPSRREREGALPVPRGSRFGAAADTGARGAGAAGSRRREESAGALSERYGPIGQGQGRDTVHPLPPPLSVFLEYASQTGEQPLSSLKLTSNVMTIGPQHVAAHDSTMQQVGAETALSLRVPRSTSCGLAQKSE